MSGETIQTPGLVDLHVHFRQPSNNKSETIASGSREAMLGGYVLACDMPNNPGNPTWNEARMIEKHTIAQLDSYIPMGFYAGRQPETDEELTELVKMSHLAVGLKLYGAPTTGNHNDYEASDFHETVHTWHVAAPDKPIMFHAGANNLEDMINLVAGRYEHPLHICHVNSIEQVDIIHKAKRDDLQVTCGVCPHHLLKTSHNERTEGWFARMQPPLAEQTEAEALMFRLADGDIDIVETDHAPHSEDTKWKAERENPDGIHDTHHTTCFGVPGIKYAAPLLFYQAKRGFISMERVIDAMSTKPAEIIGVKLSPKTSVTWNMEEYLIEEDFDVNPKYRHPYLGMLAVGQTERVEIGGEPLYNVEGHVGYFGQLQSRVVSTREEEI